MPQLGSRFPLDWMGILVTRLPRPQTLGALFGYDGANSVAADGILNCWLGVHLLCTHRGSEAHRVQQC